MAVGQKKFFLRREGLLSQKVPFYKSRRAELSLGRKSVVGHAIAVFFVHVIEKSE